MPCQCHCQRLHLLFVIDAGPELIRLWRSALSRYVSAVLNYKCVTRGPESCSAEKKALIEINIGTMLTLWFIY